MKIFHEPQVNWPTSKPETNPSSRKDSRFVTSGLNDAATRVEIEVSMFSKYSGTGRRFRTNELWIFASAEVGKQGRFLNNQKACIDPRVVVEFDIDDKPYSIACDKYRTHCENLCAIAAVIEGFRTNERHDVLTIHQLMQSVSALPEVSSASRLGWWQVLDLPRNASRESIESKYKELARKRHPDAGGNAQEWLELQEAIREARELVQS